MTRLFSAMRMAGAGAVTVMALSSPVWAAATAAQKATCGHQAEVVAAIQQARLDKVKERDVADHIKPNATWPENFNTAIPLLTPWVYEMKMRDLRNKDLAAAWTEMCLQQ